mmetsp:Transcript_8268/g.17177  ORF Transcript_8268/g.17177 Transcript_8268/m.17177 type:complete len:489 (+) Transcript_8268:86-1552(+)
MASMVASSLWINTLLRNPKVRKQICKKHFQTFDANSDGHLDETELGQMCNAVAKAMCIRDFGEPEIHGAFQRFDKDNSGGLTYDEFVHFFEHLLQVLLPLLQAQEGNGNGRGSAEALAREEANGTGGIEVCIRTMAGNAVSRLKGFEPTDTVADLLQRLSHAAGKPSATLQLLRGVEILEAEASFSKAGIAQGEELTLRFLSVAELTALALKILDNCPEGPPKEYSEFRIPPADPRGFAEWKDWRDKEAPTVTGLLEALSQMVETPRHDVVDLAVRSLYLPPPMLFMSDVKQGQPIDELYPDDLTTAAAHLLHCSAEAGEETVARVLGFWVGRLRVGDVTTSVWTLDQVLRVLPGLTAKTEHRLLIADLDIAVCQLLNIDVEDGELRTGPLAKPKRFNCIHPDIPDVDWRVRGCYTAILRMLQGCRRPPPAPKLLYGLAVLNSGNADLDIEGLVDMARDHGIYFRDEKDILLRVGMEHAQELEEDWLC